MSVNLLLDGTYTTPMLVNPRRWLNPFEGVNSKILFEEDYHVLLSSYVPLALDTTHPTDAGFYLVREVIGVTGVSDLLQITRTYSAVPSVRSEYTTQAYTFIGFSGYESFYNWTPTVNIPGRKPFTRTVACRIQYDYFFCSSGQPYATPDVIPIIQAQKYYYRYGTPTYTTSGGIVTMTGWTQAYTAGSANDVNYGLATDYIYDCQGSGAPLMQPTYIPCIPSRATYQGWINAGTEIAVENSTLARYAGNIWVRATKYVIAQ